VNRRAAAAIALCVGCNGPSASDEDGDVVLRVSAAAGLADLMPGIESTGSTAAAMDLVFPEIGPNIESLRVEGANVILVRNAKSRLSAREIADTLRGKELRSARALDDRHIEARFADDKTAALVAQYAGLGLDIGPFRVAARDDKHIRLVSRGKSKIDVIEIVGSSRADEWRKLLAHELDVVPWASSIYRDQFRDMKTIRTLDIPPTDSTTLFFNVRAPELTDPAIRRRIASAIHREAIARLACGDPACAVPDPSATGNEHVLLPRRLSLIVPMGFTTFTTAAKVLRHQFFELGIELDVEPVSLEDYLARTKDDFTLALGPLSLTDLYLTFFLSRRHPRGTGQFGFASEEFDAAMDRGDLASAKAILDREMPFTRLFESRTFAAVDEAFCGEVTPSSTSWLWLSELYPCEEGERP
jgi:hypothetical protein